MARTLFLQCSKRKNRCSSIRRRPECAAHSLSRRTVNYSTAPTHAESRLHLLSLSNGASLHRIIAYGLPRLPFTFPLDSSNPFISSRAVDQKLCLNASRASLRTVLRNTATIIAHTFSDQYKSYTGLHSPSTSGLEVETPAQCIQGSHELQVHVDLCFYQFDRMHLRLLSYQGGLFGLSDTRGRVTIYLYISGISGMIPQSNPFTVGYGLGYEVIMGATTTFQSKATHSHQRRHILSHLLVLCETRHILLSWHVAKVRKPSKMTLVTTGLPPATRCRG
ncbi:hypothetical protein B0H13DRAFT_1897551 [Mycena leptocephala]|nr:hypothetical protein B0H13DRAFT_1897551 [Mycena leptocephala]